MIKQEPTHNRVGSLYFKKEIIYGLIYTEKTNRRKKLP